VEHTHSCNGTPGSSADANQRRLLCSATLRKLEADTSAQALRRLLSVYRTELHKRSATIADAHDRQDNERLQICVHALKSSALSFGCEALAEKCLQVEDFCLHALHARAFDHCEALLLLIQKTLDAVDAFESAGA
jgi:HPt (histidine-containing phosphotransfer) domain-containing protein